MQQVKQINNTMHRKGGRKPDMNDAKYGRRFMYEAATQV